MSGESRIDPSTFDDPLSNYEPVEYSSALERALAEETVDAIQVRPFAQISASARVSEAIQTLHKTQVSSLLVVDEGRLVGIFTERDVLERVVEQYARLSDAMVSDVMTTNPTVIYETDPAAAAVAAIAVAGHRHVPVLRVDGTLLGVVSPRRVFEFSQNYF